MPNLFDFLTSNSTGANLLRAGLGALAGKYLVPQPHYQTPVSAATLNAATLPIMEREAQRRISGIMGMQGAKGGISASDLYERNNLRMQLAQNLARQSALNQISANQAQNAATAFNNQVAYQRFMNPLTGALIGYSLFNPAGSQAESQALKDYLLLQRFLGGK